MLALLARREAHREAVEAAGEADRKSARWRDKALLDDLFGAKGLLAVPKERVEKLLPDESRARLAAMRAEMERLKKAAPPRYPVVHTLKDGRTPKAMTVLIRGNPETPGPEAPRRFLSILGGDAVRRGQRPARAGPGDRQPRTTR